MTYESADAGAAATRTSAAASSSGLSIERALRADERRLGELRVLAHERACLDADLVGVARDGDDLAHGGVEHTGQRVVVRRVDALVAAGPGGLDVALVDADAGGAGRV